MARDNDAALVPQTAHTIFAAFAAYQAAFRAITRRAKQRFEQRDWLELQKDAEERLDQHKIYVDTAVETLKESLATQAPEEAFWIAVKALYTQTIARRHDIELAESFYNSVTMRVIATRVIDPTIEYVGSEFKDPPPDHEDEVYRTYPRQGPKGAPTATLIRGILEECDFAVPYRNLERSSTLVAEIIDEYLAAGASPQEIAVVEMAEAIFYRGKGAYLVGRICTTSQYIPLVLALFNGDAGIYVDAVLLTQDEVSIIFSFARSYFHVEVERPHALVAFLKSIMPLKPIAELYISLGYNKHGKTELYRALMRHLARSTDQFVIARGERGMVMVVFTLPSYDVVFKVIKDSFDYPKNSTRREVMERYQLVFKHDRGGRLVDAQEFEYLRFQKDRFAPDLLAELRRVAAHSVRIEGDYVEIRHLYTERRLLPLNLYLHEVDEEQAAEAVIDYGQTIKDLAATNIFPGDILLKNFGVTRHGRVVFYDYDELCLLTDCTFREMPEENEDDMFAETLIMVGEYDVFPEELKTFLGLPPRLRDTFSRAHGDLFAVAFWQQLQARLAAHEVIDIFPYKEVRRLPPEGA